MTVKRFNLIIDSEWWIVEDTSIKSNKYRNDLDGDDAYRGLREGELTEKEVVDLLNELHEENEELKKILGGILLEVKRDISNTNQTGEIRVFINPNSFNLISEVLQKYGVLKEWYE